MRKLGVALVSLFVASAVALGMSVGPVRAADVADPSYQIKLKLTPEAVNADGSPSDKFRANFTVLGRGGVERSRYFDTGDLFYSSRGWSVRIRNTEGGDSLDVTFKYRQAIVDNSLSKTSAQDALERARTNNFDASDDNYQPQVNASFNTATLDFSNKKSVPCLTAACAVPTGRDAQVLLSGLEPGKMLKATGAELSSLDLSDSPEVEQQTWRVDIGGIETDLEISTFAGQKWIEVSEEDSSRSDAIRKRDTLVSELSRARLLEPEDAFKTDVVLRAR